MRFIRLVFTGLLMLLLSQASVFAQSESATVAPGTVITMQNWKQYKQFMPDGMANLFAGTYYWKMPPDIRIQIGAPNHFDPPTKFIQDTEKYGGSAKIVQLPNGAHSVTGYVAGLPFPTPADPQKGYKILVNMWYRYTPYLMCGKHGVAIEYDRFHNASPLTFWEVDRKFSFISDIGMPITDPSYPGVDRIQYNQVVSPEQARYTAQIKVYYVDPSKDQDSFAFIPSLRRVLRLSSAARCSPHLGSDAVEDDSREGFNGGIVLWDGTFLHDQDIISLTKSDPHQFGNVYSPQDYYQSGLTFPTPTVGTWEVRPTYVIDAHRLPPFQKGYCYGKEVMWIDKDSYGILWKDQYDPAMKFWKTSMALHLGTPVPGEGFQREGTQFIQLIIDQQNAHYGVVATSDPQGRWFRANSDCKDYEGTDFTNVKRFATPAGLWQVMR
ncbi:MAG: DUF1329 domain-containing protein [Candidatus Binataceae bacterium]|nr:DUF1329 domain-containing protein [Candidatus Binataceae bacterium]